MNKLHYYLIIIFVFASSALMAQQSVSGVVTDDAGNPLPSVNVVVQGTTQGVSTDFDGLFSIRAIDGQTLEFSYLGFETQSIVVSGASLDVVMIASASELSEVVVIGYGTTQKKDLTGAVDLVSAKDFSDGNVVSTQQLLQGKVAGVTISSNNGGPGEGANVLIRGIGSLNLNSNPLYVVDGIPLDGGGIGGSRNPLNSINPADIEAISVLKDASASAIYGSRAANGVILITTKKGSKSGGTKVSLTTKGSTSTPVDFVDVLSADEFRSVINGTGNEAFISKLGTANTDWQSHIYQEASGVDTNLSVSSSIYGVPVRMSVGQTDQEGILIGDQFERITSSITLSPSFLDNALRVNLSARLQNTENDFANRGAIGTAVQFDPTKPIYDVNSPYDGFYSWMSNGKKLSLSPTNPLALLHLTEDQSEVDRLIANAKIDYDLPFVDNLTATVSVGLDESEGTGFTETSKFIPTDEDGFNGSGSEYNNKSTNQLFDAYLNFNHSFSEIDMSLTAGYSYQSFEYDNSSSNYKEILNPDGSVNEDNSVTNSFVDTSKNVLLSYFGRANFNFNDLYLLTATLRADASSKLSPDDRWGYFPSVALAWNIHNEGAFDVKQIDQLKLRIGYGQMGNVNGLGDYNFLTRYVISTEQAQYGFGSSFYKTFRPAPINKDLRWEVAQTLNAGLDFSMFSGRLSGSVNAYIKETKDLIATAITDPFTNFGSTISANIGDMENKGIEVDLNAVVFESDDFQLNLGYNVSFNDNTITRLENEQNVGGISGGIGNTIQYHQTGLAPFTYYVYKQIYDADGKPIEGAYADLNSDGVINNDDKYFYKDPYADINMGATLNLRYKAFDLSVAGRASIGNYVYNNNASTASIMSATQLNRLDNLNAGFLNHGFNTISDKNFLSDYFIQNASFFRLDNVTLGYTIDNAMMKSPIRLFVSADNLMVVTDYTGIDPELIGGIDNNFYPRSRVVSVGVDLNF